jgi:hypothetical protein
MVVKSKGRRGGVKSMLVEPYFQVKLGLMFIVVNLFFSVLIFGVMGWFVWDISGAMSTYFELTGQDSSLVFDKLQTPLLIIGLLVVAFIVTTLLVAVSYTHKIYGPLVSINRFLDEYLEGQKPAPLALRDGDQLQDLAQKLNQLSERKRV